jgi:hypothetical protein
MGVLGAATGLVHRNNLSTFTDVEALCQHVTENVLQIISSKKCSGKK